MEWWWRKLTVLTENDYTLTLFAEPTSPNDEAMIAKKMSLLFWPPKLLKPYFCIFTSSIPSVANRTDFFSLDQITTLYWEMGESESEVAQLCLTLSDCMDCSLPGSSVHGIFPGKNTGVGCHFLLQEILPTQGLNLGLLHCRQMLYCLSHQGDGWVL